MSRLDAGVSMAKEMEKASIYLTETVDAEAPPAPSSEHGELASTPAALYISSFAVEIQPILREIDAEMNGDGKLDTKEFGEILTQYVGLVKSAKTGDISLASFPPEIKQALKDFDLDGSGSISAQELATGARLYKESQQQVQRLTKIFVAVIFMMLLLLAAIGGLTYGMIEATKDQETAASGLTFVKGTTTPIASASASKTSSLFDAPKRSPEELASVKTLSLSDKAGIITYGWTITGYAKDTSLGSVTFHSARGDKILVTASKATATEACTPEAGKQICVGRKLVEMTQKDSRRLQEISGSGARGGGALYSTVTDEKPEGEGTRCDDGSMASGDYTCPVTCPSGHPEDCQMLMEGGAQTKKCECPSECPDEQESCYTASDGGVACDSVTHPFRESTPCQPMCSNWRDSKTGECMAYCDVPMTYEVMENNKEKDCPKRCPQHLEGDGNAWKTEWAWPDAQTPPEQLVERMCPKLCSDKTKTWGPDFHCQSLGPAPVVLGTAGHFVILAKAGITNVPQSSITGDVGVSPIAASAVTGFALVADSSNQFATEVQIVGKVYAADYAPPTPSMMTTAISDMETAYTDASSRVNPDFNEKNAGLLGGLTLEPGLYKWTTEVNIADDVTIRGSHNDTWIFQTTGSFYIAGAKRVILAGGAQAKNIVWVSAEEMTVGAGAHMEGIVIVKTAAKFLTGASFNGRVLSQTAVTLQKNAITQPV
jgi:Ca2+-binding EF-hand superfamily protein